MKNKYYKAMIGGKAYIIKDSNEYSYAARINNDEDQIIYNIEDLGDKYRITGHIENPSQHTQYLIEDNACYIALSYRRTSKMWSYSAWEDKKIRTHRRWHRKNHWDNDNWWWVLLQDINYFSFYISKEAGDYRNIGFIDYAANNDYGDPERPYLFALIKIVLVSHNPVCDYPNSRVYCTNSLIKEIEVNSKYI